MQAGVRRGRSDAGFTVAILATVVTLTLAGCGDATTSSSHGATTGPVKIPISSSTPSVHPISGGARTTSGGHLRSVANDVCQAVREGAPTIPRPPYSLAGLARYAAAARPATSRTLVSLQRLASMGAEAQLGVLVSGYTELQAVYASARGVTRVSDLSRTIQAREETLSSTARSLGLPACAVAGR